jgi:hypothetical protein
MELLSDDEVSHQPCTSCVLRNTCDSCYLPNTTTGRSPTLTDATPPNNRWHTSPGHSSSSKRQRLSIDEAHLSSSITPDDEINSIRKSLSRLEGRLATQQSRSSSEWGHQSWHAPTTDSSASLPEPLNRVEEILSILPCQSDCEILFEYILQEVRCSRFCIKARA